MAFNGSWYADANASKNKYLYNGKELNEDFGLNLSDYGARWYDASIGRWWQIDPKADLFPLNSLSQYVYVRNSPVQKIDVDGNWDIDVHVFGDRSIYGYGIAVLKDMYGKEVYRFTVRVEGQNRDRTITKGDTPLGTYDIPNKNSWISGKSRKAYGPNPRLSLSPKAGEIKTSGRDLIRIHGGRQEFLDKNGNWQSITNPQLKKTEGCMRSYDTDIITLKAATDQLEAQNAQEYGGQLNVIDDLINQNGNFIIPPKQPLQMMGRGQSPSSGGGSESWFDYLWNAVFSFQSGGGNSNKDNSKDDNKDKKEDVARP